MQLFGTAISAAWPIWLAAIPLALAALVYLFRKRGSSKPQVAATLFLLSRIPQYSPHRRRFLPPLQFWLELVLALALALAASGITSRKTGERIAVVVDTSKSMGARSGAYETRLEAALRLAQVDVSQAPGDATFAVYTLGRGLTLQNRSEELGGLVSQSKALEGLSQLRSTYEVDNLSDLVRELIGSREYDGVWLYTDKRVEGVGPTGYLRVTSVPYDPDLVNNVWISSVALRGDERSDIEVGVSRVGGGNDEISLSAICTDRLSGETFTSQPLTQRIAAHANKLVQLAKLTKPWSYCRIALNHVDGDLLELDDEAWIVRSQKVGDFGLISALSPEALGVNRLPFGRFVALSGDEEANSRDLLGVIYHRTAPKAAPESAAMVVYPDVGTKLWGGVVVGDVKKMNSESVEISRWDESHPILRYVRPGLLALPTARVLKCPSAAQPIVYSASGPIVCAGEEHGKRFVIVGFEVFPFDGLKTATVSILTLNILHWLSESAIANGADLVDVTALKAESSDQVKVIAPRQELVEQRGSQTTHVPRPGVVAIAKKGDMSTNERLIAVNALSDQESDLSLQAPIELGLSSATAAQSLEDRADLNTQSGNTNLGSLREAYHFEELFSWCAFFILILDLARRIVSRVGWRERT